MMISMKKFLLFLALLMAVTGLHYLVVNWKTDEYLAYEMELGGMNFPVGTRYQSDVDENLILTLQEGTKGAGGIWPAGTTFYFEGGQIFGIEVNQKFQFAEFDFYQAAKIAFKYQGEQVKHVVQLTRNKSLDGVSLKRDCLLKFNDYILDSAVCPNDKEVFFKRRVDLSN